MVQPFPAPTFGHAAEAFVIAHALRIAPVTLTAQHREGEMHYPTVCLLGGQNAEGCER